jgi:hypothetical protein
MSQQKSLKEALHRMLVQMMEHKIEAKSQITVVYCVRRMCRDLESNVVKAQGAVPRDLYRHVVQACWPNRSRRELFRANVGR